MRSTWENIELTSITDYRHHNSHSFTEPINLLGGAILIKITLLRKTQDQAEIFDFFYLISSALIEMSKIKFHS